MRQRQGIGRAESRRVRNRDIQIIKEGWSPNFGLTCRLIGLWKLEVGDVVPRFVKFPVQYTEDYDVSQVDSDTRYQQLMTTGLLAASQ